MREFALVHLVVSLGMDIYEGDPLGRFKITSAGIAEIGHRIAALGLPTAIIMEGGYIIPTVENCTFHRLRKRDFQPSAV